MGSRSGCAWVQDKHCARCCLCGREDKQIAVCPTCGHQFCESHRMLGWDRIMGFLRLRKPQCAERLSERYASGGY